MTTSTSRVRGRVENGASAAAAVHTAKVRASRLVVMAVGRGQQAFPGSVLTSKPVAGGKMMSWPACASGLEDQAPHKCLHRKVTATKLRRQPHSWPPNTPPVSRPPRHSWPRNRPSCNYRLQHRRQAPLWFLTYRCAPHIGLLLAPHKPASRRNTDNRRQAKSKIIPKPEKFARLL